MKQAIDFINRKLASSEYSHTTGWAHLRANQLKHATAADVKVLDDKVPRHSQDWREYDVVYAYHGVDFQPGSKYMNVFDGLVEHSAKFFERFAWPQHDHIKYFSLDYPMPDYGWLCKTKKGTKSPYWQNADWDKVSERCKVDYIFDPMHEAPGGCSHLVIGDSHAGSVYRPPAMVLRKDGRTLAGIIKKTIAKEIYEFGSTAGSDKWCKDAYYDRDPRFAPGRGFQIDKIMSATCYWGSIDVRHHLCREADPIAATKDLISRYEKELVSFSQHNTRSLELVCLLPIEDESRVIPKTGYYEGTPFYGTRAERQAVLHVFNSELQEVAARCGWKVFTWPKEWYDMDGLEFMNTFMERPRSVHLAYKYYRWDLKADEQNQRLIKINFPEVTYKLPTTRPQVLLFD